jgi:hypothetical protein
LVALVFGTAVLLTAVPALGQPAAQEATATATAIPPTPSAYPFRSLKFALQAQVAVSVQTGGALVVSAATLTLAPGAATLDFTVDGTTVIAVQSGQVTVKADDAVVSVVDISPVIGIDPVAGSPGPLSARTVNTGEQVVLPAGATASLRNDGTAPASLLVLAVTPAGRGTTPATAAP